jgi:UDP-glucose 4-epimerase
MQKVEELTANDKEKVLITGNAGALGRDLVMRLIQDGSYQLIGVDRRPLENMPEGIEHLPLDLRRKSAIEVLYKLKPKSIIHLGVVRNPQRHRNKRANIYYFNLESTTQLLRLAERLSIRKFVFLSTANLYGPSAATNGILTEDSPLHGANKSPEFRDLVSLDMMMQSFFWKRPKTETIILRPCHIVGGTLHNAPSKYFKMNMIPTILGFDPMLQLLHEDDLISAIIMSLKSKVRGIFNLAGPDVAPLSRIIKALDRPTIPIPETLLKLFMAGSFLSRQSNFPIGELDHLKYSCIIDTNRAEKELGFTPKMKISAILKDMKKAYEKEKAAEAKKKGRKIIATKTS